MRSIYFACPEFFAVVGNALFVPRFETVSIISVIILFACVANGIVNITFKQEPSLYSFSLSAVTHSSCITSLIYVTARFPQLSANSEVQLLTGEVRVERTSLWNVALYLVKSI